MHNQQNEPFKYFDYIGAAGLRLEKLRVLQRAFPNRDKLGILTMLADTERENDHLEILLKKADISSK